MNTQDYIVNNGHKLWLPGFTDFLDMIDGTETYYEKTMDLCKPWEHWKTSTALCDHETTFNH